MAKRKRPTQQENAESQVVLPQVSYYHGQVLQFYISLINYCVLQKKHYRQRAHANPFSDHSLEYPNSPNAVNWPQYFPNHPGKAPEFADIGCGFGGLLITLAPLFPDTLMLGEDV